jgi:hypothetical protein
MATWIVSLDNVVALGMDDDSTEYDATVAGAEALAELLDRYLHGDEDAAVFVVEREDTDTEYPRTVTVSGGEGATVRAVQAAREKYGDDWTAAGLIDTGTPPWSGPYVYQVERRVHGPERVTPSP